VREVDRRCQGPVLPSPGRSSQATAAVRVAEHGEAREWRVRSRRRWPRPGSGGWRWTRTRATRDSRVELAAAEVYVLIEDRSAAEQAVHAANVAIGAVLRRLLEQESLTQDGVAQLCELELAEVRRLTRTPTASTPPAAAVSSPVAPQASDAATVTELRPAGDADAEPSPPEAPRRGKVPRAGLSDASLELLHAAVADPAIVARYSMKTTRVPGSPCLWWTRAVSARGHGRFWLGEAGGRDVVLIGTAGVAAMTEMGRAPACPGQISLRDAADPVGGPGRSATSCAVRPPPPPGPGGGGR